jgi:hypothetical protein
MTTFPRAATLLLALTLSASARAGGATAFGKPLRGLRPTALADVLAEPRDGREVRLEGKVQAVCQNKGCWLELRQGTSSVHVTFEGYAFFLPKDAAGKDVVLEGTVKVRQPTPQEIEHLEHEGAGASAGSRVSIEASGVELREKE